MSVTNDPFAPPPEPIRTSAFTPDPPPPRPGGDRGDPDGAYGITTAPRPRPAPRLARLGVVLAWLAIAAMAGFIVYRGGSRERDPSSYLVPLQMQARYVLGVHHLKLPGAPSGASLWEQSRANMERGPYGQRLRAATVAGELAGPTEAREVLRRLEADRAAGTIKPASDEQVEIVRLLDHLYADYAMDEAAPWRLTGWFGGKEPEWVARVKLGVEQKQRLRHRLGWFGDLALAPPGGHPQARRAVIEPTRWAVIGLLVVFALGAIALLVGTVLAVVLVVLAILGKLGGGLRASTGHGGVYAETFALYMIAYLGLSYLMGFVPLSGAAGMMIKGSAAMLGAMAPLGWPLVRGVSWREVRADLGLTFGAGPVREVLAGLGSYLCALPLLVGGLVITWLLMLLQKELTGFDASQPGEGPSHPISGVALARDPWLWVGVVVLAVVLAPIVEEIMFRGVLYRHLREGTRDGGWFLSIAAAVVISGFVFAVIHPQGLLGVPPLMALASSFALSREWRGSLVGPMIAHAINNGVVTLFLFLMAG